MYKYYLRMLKKLRNSFSKFVLTISLSVTSYIVM